MDKKHNFNSFLSGAGKTAKDLFNTAVQAADQNDDGKFDLADMSFIAETVGSNVKKGAQAMRDGAEEKAKLLELKTLQPIFSETLDEADFLMPKFIRITDRDKKRAESEVCQGSIGYGSDQKGLHIVNIFRDSLETFGLTFYPDCDSEFYYVDPSDRDRYISLDDYFKFLKIARVNELQKIAQDLGAKHFRITYKEKETSFVEKKSSVHAKATAKADADHYSSESRYSNISIAAEMDCPGHAPVKPQLKYLQRDPSIQTLIAMRMDESSPLLHQKFMIEFSNSSGLKESDALKIDAVLKGMKLGGSITVASEAKKKLSAFLNTKSTSDPPAARMGGFFISPAKQDIVSLYKKFFGSFFQKGTKPSAPFSAAAPA